ncbi:alpha-2-macroglobulin family protein [Chitinophaga sp. Cy-1792]|uniref:alpha-2-macroglobulin family protein n=1 Tax=Chitinophaga sp. Cy-1792 TaxID=2608339 RepID=UPI00141ED0ED|nr:alpha-2-macroglobulin family protein [Chitinophaga sp. Cy-1792]NIG55180.1 hypothetical protein [Chitinophaga sp. Cy-1792]
MKWILTIFLFCYLSNTVAQQPLSEAATQSHVLAVYKISNKEALEVFKTMINYPDELEFTRAALRQDIFWVDDNLLHTPVRIIKEDERAETVLPPGHYILVKTVDQKTSYSYLTVPSAYTTLLNNNKELLLVITDINGNLITDAQVHLNNRIIPYNKKNQCYLLPSSGKKGILRVQYKDVVNYRHLLPATDGYSHRYNEFDTRWEFWWHRFGKKFNPAPAYKKFIGKFNAHKKSIYQYMVINKPTFKPGDTVKLKSFIAAGNGVPWTIPLQVRLRQHQSHVDTVLATISPYRPGGYDYSFVLNDSLHLHLDNYADINLVSHEKNSRRTVSSKSFSYEAYELTNEKFEARIGEASKEYYRKQPVKLYFRATDQNDLPVLDAKVKVTVQVQESSQYVTGITYIPDIIYEKTIPLETIGETLLILPDSIFPNAQMRITINCTLENSAFDKSDQTLSIRYNQEPGIFRFKEEKDSLAISYETRGQQVPVIGQLYITNRLSDTGIVYTQQFPCKIVNSAFTHELVASTDSVSTTYNVNSNSNEIIARGGIFGDSLIIKLDNPNKVPFWYQLAKGKRIIERGYGTDYNRTSKSGRKTAYKLMLQYITAGIPKERSFYFLHGNHNLNVDIDAPAVIQPGGKTRVTVKVTDADDKPVKDADVTAYAITSKFKAGTPYAPKFPYYNRKSLNSIKRYKFTETIDANFDQTLNWDKWKSVLGLDTMAYYRFFHPDSVLYNFEPTINGATQLAPFAVKHGMAQMPYLIWIDDQLVYIRGTSNTTYSFLVNPGYHSVRIRTSDQEIHADHIYAPAMKKTFISLNLDHSTAAIKINERTNVFTNQEKQLIDKKTYQLAKVGDRKLRYIKSYSGIYPLPFEGSESSLLIGPFQQVENVFSVPGSFEQEYVAEGNYSFEIQKGLVKQKEAHISEKYFSGKLESDWELPSLRDYVSDRLMLDSLYNEFVETLNTTFLHDDSPGTGQLMVMHDMVVRRSIRQQFLYSMSDTSFLYMRGTYDQTFARLKPGYYKLLVLMKGNGYVIHDSLQVRDSQLVVYNYKKTVITPDNDSIREIRKLLDETVINKVGGDVFVRRASAQPKESEELRTLDMNLPLITGANLKGKVSGVVKDNNGDPIYACTIQVKGTRNGVITDTRGAFTLRVPAQGELVFSMVGYERKTYPITNNKVYNITLNQSVNALNDVVVTAYGTQTRKASLSAPALTQTPNATIAEALHGKVAGISFRGEGYAKGKQKILVLIDGVPYNGAVEDLDKSAITSMQVLNGTEAGALYGSAAADGAIVITTNGKSPFGAHTAGPEQEPVAPENRLRRNFRDDAFWQPRLRTNEAGKASFDVTYPDDLTSWNTVALAFTSHKQTGTASATTKAFRTVAASLALPHFLVYGDTLDILTKITNYNQDSLYLQRQLKVDEKERLSGPVSLVNSKTELTAVTPLSTDSMRVSFLVSNDHIGDGEYRTIPINTAGTTASIGTFLALRKDSTFTINPADTTPVQVFASSSAMPVLLDEIQKLGNYKYFCNEQTASRLIALLLQKKWYEQLDSTFTGDKQINKLIRLLEQNRNQDGLWGWWKNTESEYWITAYVMKALYMATLQGFKAEYDPEAITRFVAPILGTYPLPDQLQLIDALMTVDPSFKAAAYLDTISTAKTAAWCRLKLLELKQRAGIKVSTSYLLHTTQHTNYGNTFWSDEDPGIIGTRMLNTLAIYRILRKEGGHDELLRSTRAWILENRGANGWLNTWESANVLETIGDDIIAENEREAPSLQINNQTITQFPFRQRYPATALQVQKKGNRSIYFSATQQHFVANPVRKDGAFRISSSFAMNDKMVDTLTAGKEITLQVNVEAVDDGEYVMLEIPVPAGCSFAEKSQEYWHGVESYREYYYDKVNIYCRKLRKGQHQFTVKLLPRYSGRFNLNPAKAEEMYAPALYGHEGMKKVNIQQP